MRSSVRRLLCRILVRRLRSSIVLVERVAHGGDMTWSGSAAASNQLHACFCEAQSVVCEVVGGSYIKEAVVNARWQSSVGLRGEQVSPGLVILLVFVQLRDHLLQRVKGGCRSYAAIRAYDIYAQVMQHSSDTRCRLTRERVTVLVKAHLRDNGQAAYFLCCQYRLAQFRQA